MSGSAEASAVTDAANTSETSAYAVLAPDERGHCSRFLSRTNTEHQQSMHHPFMKTIYAKTFTIPAYTDYLVGQYLIFREMEILCEKCKHTMPMAAVYDETLHRRNALASDLRFWCGTAWGAKVSNPSKQTIKYLEQLSVDAKDPWMLVCHHFLQYNAVLSGGQFLGRMVSQRAADLFGKENAGAAFYKFPESCGPAHARVQQYIESLDAVTISPENLERMIEGMRKVYSLLFALFDEAYAISPVEGMSYHDSKAAADKEPKQQSTPVIEKKSSTVPDPLSPGDQSFTLEDLHAAHGTKEGMPLLTSLLGRVYDVSSGREFFGPGGPYEMFAGHDGTYNLAVMSLKKKTLDVFEYDIDSDDKLTLAEWVAYFDNRYGRPIGQLRAPQHTVQLSDLPKPKKIPFSGATENAAEPEQRSKL